MNVVHAVANLVGIAPFCYLLQGAVAAAAVFDGNYIGIQPLDILNDVAELAIAPVDVNLRLGLPPSLTARHP